MVICLKGVFLFLHRSSQFNNTHLPESLPELAERDSCQSHSWCCCRCGCGRRGSRSPNPSTPPTTTPAGDRSTSAASSLRGPEPAVAAGLRRLATHLLVDELLELPGPRDRNPARSGKEQITVEHHVAVGRSDLDDERVARVLGVELPRGDGVEQDRRGSGIRRQRPRALRGSRAPRRGCRAR